MIEDDKQQAYYDRLEHENKVLGVRVTLLQAFVHLLHTAYDTLLNYGVNYRDLPEYKADDALDVAMRVDVLYARSMLMTWMEKLENAIVAAGKRAWMRKHNRPPPLGD